MSDSKLKPIANISYKSRTYKDKDGNEKGVWLTIGTLFSSPHGSNMSIKLDALPIGKDFDGFLAVFKREDRTEQNNESSEEVDF